MELLVVITIIALLIAMLMPVISLVRESARARVCASNLRSAGMALETIATEDSGLLPWGNFGPGGYPFSWPTAINNLGEQLNLTCPSAIIRAGNLHFTGNMQVLARRSFGSGPWKQVHTSETRPTLVMLFDSGQQASGNSFPSSENMGLTFRFLNRAGLVYPLRDSDNLIPTASGNFQIYKRHTSLQRANFLFADGHLQCLDPITFTNSDFRIQAGGRFYF